MTKKLLIVVIGTILLINISCKKDPVSSGPAIVAFQDANFEALIREEINKPTEDVLTTDLLEITKLKGEELNITNITGIEYCTNLDTLMLMKNEIIDISPLTNNINLVYLDLDENKIQDISPLGKLIALERLWLSDNQISEIDVLKSLVNLQLLHLDFNQIIDISALNGLSILNHLSLWKNQITDIGWLVDLLNIDYLDLEENQISEISPLSNLEKIRLLWLEDNQVSDIYPLTQNNGLDDNSTIYIENNPLSETSINSYIPQLVANGVTVYYGNAKARFNKVDKYEGKL